MLALQSHAIDLCNKAVKADRTQGEERAALYFYKQALGAVWITIITAGMSIDRFTDPTQ